MLQDIGNESSSGTSAVPDEPPQGVVNFDAAGVFLSASPAARALLPLDEAATLDPEILKADATDENLVAKALRTGEPASRVVAGAGSRCLRLDALPHAAGVALLITDISSARREFAELRHLAYHDSLTGLPNRRSFFDSLRESFASAPADPVRQSVLLIDIEGFKRVNDLHGHARGDELLVQLAGRLRERLGPRDILARLDDDEFAVFLPDVGSVWHAAKVAESLVSASEEPFTINGAPVEIAIRIGITVMSTDVADPETMFDRADVALRRAKSTSQARFVVFDEHLDTRARGDMELMQDLDDALANDQLTVNYQPLVDMRDGSVIGAEALLRWHHPTRGPVPPDIFVPIAEESGSINDIGEWVLEEAVRNLAAWLPEHPGLHLSINLSPSQLESKQFLTSFARTLGVHGVPHRNVMLELTETYLMEDVEKTGRDLRRFANMGVAIAIDDFGTGYSSLKYLQLLPVTHVKIDRSFIDKILREDRSRVLVEAILLMADKLSVTVVAEGVETPEQAEWLQALGCRFAQGWLYGRPVPAAAFAALLGAPARD